MLKKINPNLALIYSTFLWGTWWYPVRLIDELANNNAIPLASSFLIGGLIMGLFAVKENIKFSKKNIYLTTDNGRLLVIETKTGRTNTVLKIDSNKISRPFILDKNLFVIKDNAIIKLD